MNRIKEIRLACGIKQADVAQLFNVAQATVSGWESGSREPDFDTLIKMADLFSCSVDELIGRENAPTVEADGERKVIDISKLNPANQDRVEDYISLLLATQDKK